MNCKAKKNFLILLLAFALFTTALTGCATKSTKNDSTTDADDVSALDNSDMFTDRDKEVGYDTDTAVEVTLSDSGISCADSSVTINGGVITLSKEGTYLFTGTLSDGQIVVDADDNAKLQLVLDNASVSSKSSAALYVKSADKVFVTLAADSKNTLSTVSDYVAIDDNNIDAALFSKADLTLNGSGSLTVGSAGGHGIVSKDDLVITGGSYEITAASHSLSGKDSVRIADGTLKLTAGKDGIHSENADDMEKGFIYVAGGNIQIDCESDGFDGDNTVQIDGGTICVSAGDDGIHSDSDLILNGGTIEVTKSYEGLEGKTITITDGEITVNASDDGLNAAGAGKGEEEGNTQNGQDFQKPDDLQDGQEPPETNDMQNGQQPPEPGDMQNGQERPDRGNMQDGQERPDRGNMQDGQELPEPDNMTETGRGGFDKKNHAGNFGGRQGGFDEGTDYNIIRISGGTICVNADGDGIDSNGDLEVSGGTIYVYGPTNNGNGALDYAGDGTITGGTIVAVGASGMAMNFGTASTQGSALVTVSQEMLTGDVALTDKDGSTLLSCSPQKAYNSVLISCGELTEGETYTLTTGTASTAVTMNSLICSIR